MRIARSVILTQNAVFHIFLENFKIFDVEKHVFLYAINKWTWSWSRKMAKNKLAPIFQKKCLLPPRFTREIYMRIWKHKCEYIYLFVYQIKKIDFFFLKKLGVYGIQLPICTGQTGIPVALYCTKFRNHTLCQDQSLKKKKILVKSHFDIFGREKNRGS